MFLGAFFTDEIMTSSRIKQDDNGMSIQGKHTCDDLLALRNILHSCIVGVTSLDDGNLLPTLRVVLLWRSAITGKVASPTTVELDVAKG
jgi:hypothetical protein